MASKNKRGALSDGLLGAAPEPELELVFEGRLKRGHPTGLYRRAGYEFSSTSPTYIPACEADKLVMIRADSWIELSAEPNPFAATED